MKLTKLPQLPKNCRFLEPSEIDGKSPILAEIFAWMTPLGKWDKSGWAGCSKEIIYCTPLSISELAHTRKTISEE